MANTALDVTRDYGDGKFWTEALCDGLMDEIEADSLQKTNNLDQLIADLFPAGYTLGGTGTAFYTNPLYNKQTATDTYTSDIALGVSTDTAFVDVDATNASIVITPEVTGKYLVIFEFSEYVQSDAGAAISVETYFQLTDGTTASDPVETGVKMALIAAEQTHMIIPVKLSYIYTLTSGAARTIKLQKYVATATNVATHTLRGSSGLYELGMRVIKI